MRFAPFAALGTILTASGCAQFTSLVGLTKPVNTLTLELTLEGRPIRAAHLRAVPLNAGVVPLPATGENLEEYFYATGDTAATDEHGRATVELHSASPHLIEVTAPPFGPDAGLERMGWTIDVDSGEPRALDPVAPGVLLKAVKPRP